MTQSTCLLIFKEYLFHLYVPPKPVAGAALGTLGVGVGVTVASLVGFGETVALSVGLGDAVVVKVGLGDTAPPVGLGIVPVGLGDCAKATATTAEKIVITVKVTIVLSINIHHLS